MQGLVIDLCLSVGGGSLEPAGASPHSHALLDTQTQDLEVLVPAFSASVITITPRLSPLSVPSVGVTWLW